MLSLRDKLRAAMPESKKPVKPQPTDCYVLEKTLPAEGLMPQEFLDEETLYRITGEVQPCCKREEILFLDTETTGLSGGAGTLAFEVGVGWFKGDEMIIRQYVMRDYDEEALMLQHIRQDMAGKTLLCSFNGKTFDVPLLTSRFIMQRMRMPEMRQLDLLHAARRVWKLRLGRCNLTRLEEAVLGQQRTDDLPGALVPERFFEYLKTRDMRLFDDVLDHNFQDVASMPQILSRLISAHERPVEILKQEKDLFSMGRVLQKRGRYVLSKACYSALENGEMSAMARTHAAEICRREKHWQEAASIYRQMIASSQCRLLPYIELAKLYEHQLQQPEEALKITEQAMIRAEARDEKMIPALEKRYMRLLKKSRRN